MSTPGDDVVYHGVHRPIGGSVILIEAPGGEPLGVVRHIVSHSPKGIGWGYKGSGPADCARSLLIAALGDAAKCQACAGTGLVVYPADGGEEPPLAACDPAISREEYERTGFGVMGCRQWGCQSGYRQVPWPEFTDEFVAGWGGDWRMSRAKILAWLRDKGMATE